MNRRRACWLTCDLGRRIDARRRPSIRHRKELSVRRFAISIRPRFIKQAHHQRSPALNALLICEVFVFSLRRHEQEITTRSGLRGAGPVSRRCSNGDNKSSRESRDDGASAWAIHHGTRVRVRSIRTKAARCQADGELWLACTMRTTQRGLLMLRSRYCVEQPDSIWGS